MSKRNHIHVQSVLTLLALLCVPPYAALGDTDAYAIISKKNLFRPDRSEWTSNKHVHNAAAEKTDPDTLELFGTIIIGDRRSALICEDTTPAQGKATAYARSQSRRKRVRTKAKLYRPGDYLGSYVVSAIDEKKVELDYYGYKEILYLHEGKQPPKGDYTPLGVSQPRPKAAPKQKPVSEKLKKMQEQKRQKMERELAAGKAPAELAHVMSPDQLRKLLKFNQDLMKELRQSGGEIDHYEINKRIETFRERFLESM